ncbi:MAG: hypothetical protein GF317_22295 [Candidatus Lokiarchaeota archaeon]|nr:hypothetical protein [Candidatus Lokiarchaeota archaeon]MBD3202192.1 hypothetical protein [Candidatus Lokiarchaeota archaeon]
MISFSVMYRQICKLQKANYETILGYSIIFADYEVPSYDEKIRFVIWNLVEHFGNESYKEHNYRGSQVCLLFFPYDEKILKKEIKSWMVDVNRYTNEIPVYLLLDISHFHKEVNEQFLECLLDAHGIMDYYFLPAEAELVLPLIAIRAMEDNYPIKDNTKYLERDFSISTQLRRFIKSFSTCPVCGSRNHILSLIDFYYTSDPSPYSLRHTLMTLLDRVDLYKGETSKGIKLGIPCCVCFDKYFR